jgi:hypothetical protein
VEAAFPGGRHRNDDRDPRPSRLLSLVGLVAASVLVRGDRSMTLGQAARWFASWAPLPAGTAAALALRPGRIARALAVVAAVTAILLTLATTR